MGVFIGSIEEFAIWFADLQNIFREFELELTCDTETHYYNNNVFIEKNLKTVIFLDIDIFQVNDSVHTKEHRKETSAESYLYITSAHARHTFAGIVKSQLYRLRRLCSQQTDFELAIDNLQTRCEKSGYDTKMVESILSHGKSLKRILESQPIAANRAINPDKEIIRLVVLSGTPYEKDFVDFARKMSSVSTSPIYISIVRATGPTLGQLLFNNSNPTDIVDMCCLKKCLVCKNKIEDKSGILYSSTTKCNYKLGGGN